MRKEIYLKTTSLLTNFGGNPVSDVGKILSVVQSYNLPEKEVIPTVQEIYIKLFQEVKKGTYNQARQSWVVASGNNFESFIRNFINNSLNREGVLAVKGDRLRRSKKAQEIVKFLTLQAKRRCTQTSTGVWPDSDIVVLTRDGSGKLKAFALLNCKTSDHSRNDAVLFWALALRDNNIKYCLVTQDLDKRFIKGDDDGQISGLRKKCEAYLDRVFSTHPLTQECIQVRKLDFTNANGAEFLLTDLRMWRKDVVPDFGSDPISEEVL